MYFGEAADEGGKSNFRSELPQGVAICPAQGFASLRSSSVHFDSATIFSLSKEHTALRLRLLLAEIRTSTMSIGSLT